MGRSIFKNVLYNLLLQIATMFLPLVTVPYVSRVLGADGVGTYSYTLSISQYFILIGTLGLSLYGNRQIAYTRDNKDAMSKTFWSILLLRIATTGVALLIYLAVFSGVGIYRTIFMIQTINIVSALIDISWLYIGIEDFKKIVTRNVAIKIIGVILIFVFVKSSEDLDLYTIINVIAGLLGNAVMWLYLPSVISKVKVSIKDILVHVGPSLKLFVPQIAIQIYAVLDKTMIGLLSTVTEVGYYEQSEKIVKSVLSLVTVLGTVMLPRMSNLFANGSKEQMDDYFNNSLRGVAYISIPLTIGLISISNEFVPWFFGKGFGPVKYNLVLLAPILFLIAMSNVTGIQYLLPANRTREYTVSVTVGAAINFFINLLLIPKLYSFGACIGTLVAELAVTLIQFYSLRSVVDFRDYLDGLAKYVVSGTVMLLAIRGLSIFLHTGVSTTLIQIITGIIIYIVLLKLMKEKVNNKVISIILSFGKKVVANNP